MTAQSDALAALATLEVTVYHGTRRSLAAAILREGLRPTPVPQQVAATAQEHGVPLHAIQDHLSNNNRFSTLDSDREETVSTTADADRAARWAQRAPEARWDALRAAFVHKHPDLGDTNTLNEAADFWVMAQHIDDPPVVIELRSTLGSLTSHGLSTGKTALETIRQAFTQRTDAQDPVQALQEAVQRFFGFLFVEAPEWRIPIADATVVSVSDPLPFRVTQAQLAYLSVQSVVELGPPHVRNSAWGPPGNGDRPGGEWWPFDRVWPLLTPQRRHQLETFAGRCIRSSH